MTTRRRDYVVRLDDATGQATEVWRGDRYRRDIPGTTQYQIGMAHSSDNARERATQVAVLMARARAQVAAEAALTTLRPGRFLPGDGDRMFAGFTYGHTWNGWGMPYFTREVADQILTLWLTAPGASGAYSVGTDTYDFGDAEDPPDWEAMTVQGEVHLVDGQPVTLYPIGAGSWCWDEDTDAQGEQGCDS